MACGNTRRPSTLLLQRWLLACLLGLALPCMPAPAHAKKRRPVQTVAPVEEPAHPAPEPEHSLPALVVPPNSTPDPVVILAPEPSTAVSAAAAPSNLNLPHWALAARAGVLFPQPFAPVGTTGRGALEVGYVLVPRLQLVGILSYTQTQHSQSGQDLRLATASYRTTATARQAGLALGAMGRLFDLDARVNPTLTVALQLLGQNLQQQGSAGGASFGTTSQNSLQAGVFVGSGIEVLLGPGRLLLEANLTWVPAARAAPTGTHLGGVALDAGYRLLL